MPHTTILLPLAPDLAHFLDEDAERQGLTVARLAQAILRTYWQRHTPVDAPRPRLAPGAAL